MLSTIVLLILLLLLGLCARRLAGHGAYRSADLALLGRI